MAAPIPRTWGPTELPPPRYPLGKQVWVQGHTALVPGVIVAAHWQTKGAPWVRYTVELDEWEWQQVGERALHTAAPPPPVREETDL